MLICPSCKTVPTEQTSIDGICPRCGSLLERSEIPPAVYGAQTLEFGGVTELGLPPGPLLPVDPAADESPNATAATIELPAPPIDPSAAGSKRGSSLATMPLPPASDMPPGAATAATIELLPGGGQPGGGRGSSMPTMPLPPGAGEPQSITIRTRKLSMNDVELITGTWGGAMGSDASPRTSLKFDSKHSTGMGSSLVVNPRGLRSIQNSGPASPGVDYELLEVIGKGGMGVVYAARQASVNRLVAVKMIKPAAAADAQRREKFLSEAVVTGDLDHPNIVPIYELGTNENNALFYSMKRVQGTPWYDVIGQKPLAENLEILMKVADAVAFAHANGVVHRDLKPDNVMLGEYGEVLVMDWGLALATSSFRHSEFVTGPESMGGTPAYMAPEMATGPFELIGTASDIYLLGALLFEINSGFPPHAGETAQQCLFAAASNTIQPTEHTGELLDIAYRAMATDPSERYESVQEFQAALRGYQSHCESISLATRAEQELEHAQETSDYQSYAHALFGFQEALALWDGNARAAAGVSEARLAYATSAKTKGDFELGLSLLEVDNPDHAGMRSEFELAQRERNARQKWLTRFKRIAATLVMVVFGVISVSLFVVAEARNQEAAAKEQAIQDKLAAEKAEKEAQQAREKEKEQKVKAIAAETKAKQEEKLAREAEAKAKSAEDEERKQKILAVAAEAKAVRAKQGEKYAAYVARIGMAAAKLEDNAFDTAASLLAGCLPEEKDRDVRDWEWGHLHRLCRQGVSFSGGGTVNSVAFAPDGAWFIAAGEDGQAHVWDPKTGKKRLAIPHGGLIHAVAVSPDGQQVATAGSDGLIHLASSRDGKRVRTLTGHADRVLSAAFSPRDGRWLLSASRDKSLRIWDTTTGREVNGSPFREHAGWVSSAAFSADGSRLVTAGQDGKVIVWSFAPQGAEPWAKRQRVFLGHDGPVFAAAFSPDGREVVSGGYDKRVLVWQPEKIEEVDLKQLVANEPISQQASRSFEGHSAPIRAVSFSADGQHVLSAGDDNTVRIWDTQSGRLSGLLRGHSRPVHASVFSPDQRQVLSAGQEDQVKLWTILDYKQVRAQHGRMLEGHDDAITAVAFTRDGKRIVTASRDHAARLYDSPSAKPLRTLREGHEFLTSRAIYIAGGRRLLTTGGDSSVRIWDAATGSQLCAIEATGRNAAVAVSADGKLLLTGKSAKPNNAGKAGAKSKQPDGFDPAVPRVALWELVDGGKAARPRALADRGFGTGHRSPITVLAISPDNRWLFSGDETGAGQLWDATTGAAAAPIKGHTSSITAAAFLPDGGRLLTASHDGTVTQWDVATGREVLPVISHSNPQRQDAFDTPVTAMDVSADGKQVLTVSEENGGAVSQAVLRLWDLTTGRVVHELYRGPEGVMSVAFANAGRGALSVHQLRQADANERTESVVRKWDLDIGREVTAAGDKPFLDFRGRQETVWGAVEAPREGGILTVGGKGALLWIPPQLDHPEVFFKSQGGLTAIAFSGDGKSLVTGSSDHRVKIWNVAAGRSEFELPEEHRRGITSAQYSPVDDDLLLTASSDGTARLWQLSQRKALRVIEHREGKAAVAIRQATFSADGSQVFTAGEDGTVRGWETATGEAQGVFRLGSPAWSVACSADGKWVVAGGANGQALVFDLKSQKPLVRYSGHTSAINSVTFSPDGRRVLTGSGDRSARLWDVSPESIVADDDSAKTGGDDAAAGPADGKEVLTLRHHDQAVTSVAFSPDGRTILTAGLDGTAVLWLSDDWHETTAKK